MAQIQIYLKAVATIEADATEAQMEAFVRQLLGTTQVQTRVGDYVDAFKTAVRYLVGRPAAVNANARVTRWHVHLGNGSVLDEPES